MKSFKFLVLAVEALLVIGVSCDKTKVIWNGDPKDLAEGYSYERFNFLTEIMVDGKDVNDSLYWNTCSNYTGIDYFLNTTGSEDCYGDVVDCTTSSSINTKRLQRDPMFYPLDFKKLWQLHAKYETRERCRCLCNRLFDPKPDSHVRELLDSICLDEVMADVENNYVLTGVRLHRLNNTLTFEIQEGKLENGIILYDTLRWVPPPKKCNKTGQLTISKRTVILDDVIFSDNMVVTGVAFKRYSAIPQEERQLLKLTEALENDPFFLSVIGSELNADGNLMPGFQVEISVWDYSLKNRTNLINDDMDLPIALMLPLHNHVLSKPKENYVTFDLTIPDDGLRKFVIPYVDSQNVSDTIYSQVVKGIGLYYKGYEGYGGYIAPSIFVPA